MAIRKILFALATVVAILGVPQMVFASWWLERAHDAVISPRFYLYGLPGILFGLLLLLGVLEKAVGMRLVTTIIAVFAMAGGVLVLAFPMVMRDFAYSGVFDRSAGFQILAVRLAGGFSLAVGILVVIALLRAASPQAVQAAGGPTGTEGRPESYS